MLSSVELTGFKSFGKKTELVFGASIAAIVGPNGSGKSNVAEALRFVLGEQSMKSLRSKKGEDLIWGGSGMIPRANRAGVRVTFNNRSRRLDIDFDEVVVERVVHRDGQNEYLLNGTQVRHKDVIRLLASANIGGSGYQIISQGEADRILNAAPRERREMVEDALGLKLYQHKKAESEKKLEETRENMEKVESLRRELAPHVRFLRKQVEKIEKAIEMKGELTHKLTEYLAREHAWLTTKKTALKDERDALQKKEKEIRVTKEKAQHYAADPGITQDEKELRRIEQELLSLEAEKAEKTRALGRAEGALSAQSVAKPQSVSLIRARAFVKVILQLTDEASRAHDLVAVKECVERMRAETESFSRDVDEAPKEEGTRRDGEKEVEALSVALAALQEKNVMLREQMQLLRSRIREKEEKSRLAERDALERDADLREVESRLRELLRQEMELQGAQEAFDNEVREGVVLIGRSVDWKSLDIPQGALTEERMMQEDRRRSLERLKIKIEEYGAGNSDEVLKEYRQTEEREKFLGTQLEDLATSEKTLREIIEQLDATMDQQFTEGLEKINDAFQSFFSKLFGGGEAKLFLEKAKRKVATMSDEEDDESESVEIEEEEPIAGLSVSVQLPRKKVKGLEVLSGGERALTSIAMIFAMSQVNPPPFLILDETDAALDEANSKRYADMIQTLSKRSQLIVITHNRATMAAAGELYGVTMSHDGLSKILSVRLEEAEKVAK